MAVSAERPLKYTKADWTDFAHTGPGKLAGRYMRMFWQPVYLAPDLPPGRAKPIRIMSEDLTLYRGEGGAPHLLAFRCAHRGTQLSTGWVEGDDLRCFYHGWKYAGDGQCVEQPAEREPFCQKIQIRSYPVREYLGLIFAYLGEGEPPPLPHYSDFEEEGVLVVDNTYTRACNYFQGLENDPVHGAFVHRKGIAVRDVPKVSVEETTWGYTTYSEHENGVVRIAQDGLPNVSHGTAPPPPGEKRWVDRLSWLVPIDDENHFSFQVHLVRLTGDAARRYQERRAAWREKGGRVSAPELGEAVLRGEMRIVDIQRDRPDVHSTRVEDDVAQVGQGVMVDRTQERLGRSDVGVILLRKLWTQELRALAEGRPLRQWTRDPELLIAVDHVTPDRLDPFRLEAGIRSGV